LSENVLIAMLTDEKKELRQLAVERIMQARSSGDTSRKFIVPKINFKAKEYTEMIDWADTISEPPVTKHISSPRIGPAG
jgi:hypothetical protein